MCYMSGMENNHATSVRLSEVLGRRRKDQRYTLTAFVSLLEEHHGLKVTRQAFTRWERGQIDIRLDQAATWARALGLELSALLREIEGGTDTMDPPVCQFCSGPLACTSCGVVL